MLVSPRGSCQTRAPMRFALLSTLVLLAGCSQPNSLEWGARFERPADRTRARVVLLEFRRGGCMGDVLFSEEVLVAEGMGERVPTALDQGSYSVTARARDGECTWFASGCLEIELPSSDPAVVELIPDMEEVAACPAASCDAGSCRTSDAGTGDAGRDAPACVTCGGASCCSDCCDESCVDTSSDEANCGGCGEACALDQSCIAGVCTCPAGLGSCDGDLENGCETSVTASMEHCGACDTPCVSTNGNAVCGAGMCVLACTPGFGDCDSDGTNGCENTLDSATDCGGCGVACARANAVASCPGEVCRIGSCLSGFADCNGVDADGCEVQLNSLTDCGACRRRCDLLNATETCADGTCRILACDPDRLDCDGLDASSCEVGPAFDPRNCGGCGIRCNPGESCSGARCTCGAASGGVGGGPVCSGTSYCHDTVCAPAPTYSVMTPAPASVVYVNCTISGSTPPLRSRDEGTFSWPVPFDFRYWGTPSVNPSFTPNGVIAMEYGDPTPPAGIVGDSAAPNLLIAPLWADLVTRTAGFCHTTLGTAPNRQWVVEWEDVMVNGYSTSHLSFEVIFTEGTETIDFVYGTMNPSSAIGSAPLPSVGLENEFGTASVSPCPGGCWPASNSAVRFVPVR